MYEVYHVVEVSAFLCQNDSAPFELSVTSAAVSALLLVITIPVNLFVCLAILIDPNNELRTQFNSFTFNLALADLLVGCVTEPVSVYAHVTEALDTEHKHEVGMAVLKLFHVPYFISATASVLSIAALALERCLALSSPFRYRQYFTVNFTIVFSAAIWFVAAIFGLLNLFIDYILESFVFINTAVLLTVIVVCFACFKTRSTWRDVLNRRTEMRVQVRGGDRAQAKLTRTFGLIVAALMCSYVPACSIIYLMCLCQRCNCASFQWFRDAAFWLILLNSAVNPFVYAIRSSSFRNAIKQIILGRCRTVEKQKVSARLVKYTRTPEKGPAAKSVHAYYGSCSAGSEEDRDSGMERVQLI